MRNVVSKRSDLGSGANTTALLRGQETRRREMGRVGTSFTHTL